MLDGLSCLIAIGESEQKMTVASIMFCETTQNFNKDKISHSAYFSNVLSLIAIDRCLPNKITKLQKMT